VLVRLVDSRFARGWVSAAVLVVLCAAAGSAWASFPGRNGAIGYGWLGESAYRAGPTATSIRAVDPRSGRVRVLRDCPLRYDAGVPNTDCHVLAPRYSPDGLRIGFPSARRLPDYTGTAQPGLTTMASDGTDLAVHDTEQRYWALAWAPAGDRFLLVRQPGPLSANAIFLASLDGTELSQVTPEPTQHPDWSSRGQIAFSRASNADYSKCYPNCEDIWLMRVGGTERRLTYRGGPSPSWSPHGKKLAFVRSVSGRGEIVRGEIFLVGRHGRGLRRLTYRGGYSPVWSPDGRWIAFIRNGDLYVTRTNGRGLRRLVDAPMQSEHGEGPQVNGLDWQALPRR
jgi:Tol biopolymer transport system component